MRQTAFFVTAVAACLYGAIGTFIYSLCQGIRHGDWMLLRPGSVMATPHVDLVILQRCLLWVWAVPLWIVLLALGLFLLLIYRHLGPRT
jgi:hypothetical protein